MAVHSAVPPAIPTLSDRKDIDMTYKELLKEIDALTRTYHAFAIAIDGPDGERCHALAAHLSRKFGAPVIHMSDFRLPPQERPTSDDAGAEWDFERYNEEIATPWMKGGELVYTILDEKGEMKERLALPNAQIYIIEGHYAWHPAVTDFYDLRLFMKSSASDDAHLNAYFETYMTEALADEVLGEDFVIPAEE